MFQLVAAWKMRQAARKLEFRVSRLEPAVEFFVPYLMENIPVDRSGFQSHRFEVLSGQGRADLPEPGKV